MENQKNRLEAVEETAIVVENSDRSNALMQVQAYDLTNHLPDLNTAEALPLDLMSDYWTPETKGEEKRVFFYEIGWSHAIDQETGETFTLECAFFIERDEKGQVKQIRNGSKRLVGALIANKVEQGTPLLITYMGKKKNRTNSFSSDSWSIKLLRVNI